jgi:hypothetical protein
LSPSSAFENEHTITQRRKGLILTWHEISIEASTNITLCDIVLEAQLINQVINLIQTQFAVVVEGHFAMSNLEVLGHFLCEQFLQVAVVHHYQAGTASFTTHNTAITISTGKDPKQTHKEQERLTLLINSLNQLVSLGMRMNE